jgi:hypothetical protein
MASSNHIQRLAEGAESWNHWRKENPSLQPDLAGCVLGEVVGHDGDLTGIDLSGADLTGANLTGVNLGGDDWTGSELLLVSEGIPNVEPANFPGARLHRARLSKANLRGNYLFMVDLSEATLVEADLREADLSLADLRCADLTAANLARASLRRAKLEGARLSGVNLTNARHLRTANVGEGCQLDRETMLKSGLLPIEFIRRCGLSDEMIDEAREALGVPKRLLSCFLSHSTLDRAFADSLQQDLARYGIKCWYSPTDMIQDSKKSHEQIRDELETMIDIHDRTVVVLSKNSINSAWVEIEVMAAAGPQPDWARVKQLVLIRIDTAHERVRGELKWLLAGQMIIDFTEWSKPGKYDVALQQLIQVLQGSDPNGEFVSGGQVVLDAYCKPFDVVDIGKPVSAQSRRKPWRSRR